MAKVALTIRIEPAVKAALERVAHDEERSLAAVVSRILTAWAKKNGKQ